MFKIGDKIRDISNGSGNCTGVITKKKTDVSNGWWVLWKTGHSVGEELWLHEEDIEMVCAAPDNRAIRGDLDGETITIMGIRYRLIKVY